MTDPTEKPRELALHCHHLDVFYGHGAKRHHAVRDVSFEVFKGETFGLVGGSGCGKSTILRMLAGLDGDWRGEVAVLGQVRSAREAPARHTLAAHAACREPASSEPASSEPAWSAMVCWAAAAATRVARCRRNPR